MFETIKLLLCKLLRIPPEPCDPLGSTGSVLVFRASPNYFRYKLLKWACGAVIGVLVALIIACVLAMQAMLALKASSHGAGSGLLGVEMFVAAVLLVGGAIFKTALGFFLVRLDYEMRWYKLSDRSLRIREGLFSVKEMTMTFANIQNIEITQGPLQRLFKIYDLKVESAGGGGGLAPKGHSVSDDASAPHIAWFRGVSNAEEIRGIMRERLKGVHDSGLGHPEEERLRREDAQAPQAPDAKRLEALRASLFEASALRLALENAAK